MRNLKYLLIILILSYILVPVVSQTNSEKQFLLKLPELPFRLN